MAKMLAEDARRSDGAISRSAAPARISPARAFSPSEQGLKDDQQHECLHDGSSYLCLQPERLFPCMRPVKRAAWHHKFIWGFLRVIYSTKGIPILTSVWIWTDIYRDRDSTITG